MKRWSTAALMMLLTLAATVPALAQSAGAEEPQEHGLISRYLLMDTHGNTVSDRDFPGSFQLIAFGYTFCPDICPTTLTEMSVVMKQLKDLSEHVQPIFITVDPERDTPEVLSRYTAFFHPRIIGLTASPELVRRVADNFKVRYEKHLEPGGDPSRYSVDHSAGMYLLGPDGRFVTKFAYATPPTQVAERIRDLMARIDSAASNREP